MESRRVRRLGYFRFTVTNIALINALAYELGLLLTDRFPAKTWLTLSSKASREAVLMGSSGNDGGGAEFFRSLMLVDHA